VAARRRGTHWMRVGAALCALLLSAVVFAERRLSATAVLGLELFVTLTWLTFFLCAIAGVGLTSDCLSEERREGTLGLLFLTDLHGYDIVLGKWVASSVHACYCLVAVIPILAISFLLGGVTALQLARVALVLAVTLFCSLAMGVLVSLWFTNARNAALATFLGLFTLTAGPFLALLFWRVNRMQLPEEIVALSPAFAAFLATAPAGLPTRLLGMFWPSVLTVAALGLLCLVLASLILPLRWRDRPASPAWAGLRRRWLAWLQWDKGFATARQTFRTRLLDRNPFLWLTARARWQPLAVWGLLLGTAALCAWSAHEYPSDWRSPEPFGFVSYGVHLVLKGWIASAVVHRLAADPRTGALELLLSTPLSLRQIVAGQFLALRHQFGGPLLVLLAADACFCYWAMRLAFTQQQFFLWLYGAHMAMLIADVVAIAYIGLWSAAASRSGTRATALTLGRIGVVPWGCFVSLLLLVEWFQLDRRWQLDWDETTFLTLWFGLGLAADVGFGLYAGWMLRHQFRQRAAERFAPPRGRRWPGWFSTR